MKRGNRSLLISVSAILFILAISCAAAQFDWGYGYDRITLEELAQNEWVNVALLFLLVFAVCLFVLRDVFQRSYGAAVIIALVVAAIGSIGFVSYYGPIIPKIRPWLLVLALAAIVLILWRHFGKLKGLIWILFVLALLWLFWGRRQLCQYAMVLPSEACIVLDFIAIAIVIVAAFTLIWRWLAREREKIEAGAVRVAPARERPILSIGVRGNGTTRPAPRDYSYRRGSRVTVVARPGTGATLHHWEVDGIRRGRPPAYTIRMDTNHTLVAVFTGAGAPAVDERRLRAEYRNLVRDNDRIFRRAGNRIPARGTRLGERRHRNLQRMKQIEELARRHGFRL